MCHTGAPAVGRRPRVVSVGQGLRERKKEQTRTAITDAALDLFERNGFDATTIEDIAEAADVSPRTFFRYFDSKIDVVFPGKPEDEAALCDVIDDRPASEGPIEAAHNVIRSKLAQLLEGDREAETAMRQLRVVMANPTLRALAVEHSQYHRDELASAFARRMDAAPDALAPQVLAAAVGESIWVIVQQWVATGAEPRALTAMVDETFTLLRTGFG